MSAVDWIVLLVAAQRLGELVYANRNTRRLLADGGIEHGARHYPLFVILHAAWLIAIWALANLERPFEPVLLGVFAILQILRIWIVVTMGRFWTTRIVTVANAPLVRRGPYRWMRHPNYAVVVAEIAVLPLAFGLWEVALVFSIFNDLLLFHRIRVEEAALKPRRGEALAGR